MLLHSISTSNSADATGKLKGGSMRILFLVMLTLTGCASFQNQNYLNGQSSFAKKDYAAAYNHFIECVNETKNTACMYNIGASAHNMGNDDEAGRWFTLAARYGQQNAISQLTKMGLPVPTADLAQRQAAQPDLLRSLGQGLSIAGGALGAGAAPAAPVQQQPNPNISCRSYKIGNSVYTDCQ